MLEWYTTLLTFPQAIAVYLVSAVVLTFAWWRVFEAITPNDGFASNFGAGMGLAAITYPFAYWSLWLVVAFFDLIGWLWAQ